MCTACGYKAISYSESWNTAENNEQWGRIYWFLIYEEHITGDCNRQKRKTSSKRPFFPFYNKYTDEIVLWKSQTAELIQQFMFQIMFAEWIKFSKSDVWTLNHLMSKRIMKFCRHEDGWLSLPYPISSSVPSGCLYSVNQQAVNIVFQQESTSGGLPLNNKVSSLIPPLLTFQYSHPWDVKVHLPIKHPHKTPIHPLFRLYGLSSHNYPWSHNQRLILRLRHELWVCICVCERAGRGERKGSEWGREGGVWTEVVPQTGGEQKQPILKNRRKWALLHGRRAKQTRTRKRTWSQILPTDPPPTRLLSLTGFSPLALSCFPDSRWRPDRRAEWEEVRLCDDRPGSLSVTSTLPACCLKINWQIETQNCCRSCLTPFLFTFLLYIYLLSILTPCSLTAGALWV